MSSLRKATFESLLTGFGGQLVLMISGIIVARILGAEGRGYLAMLVLFPVLISQLGMIGLPHATTYYVAVNPNHALAIFNSLRVPFLFQITILPIIHFSILKFYLYEQTSQIALAGYFTTAVIPGLLAHRYGLALLQGLRMFRPFNILRLMPATAYACTILLVFVIQIGTLPVIVFSWMCLNVIVGVSTLCYAYQKINTLQLSGKIAGKPSIVEMLSFGIKGFIGAISPLDSFRLDQLLAGILLSPAALGFYVVAQAITNLPRFISQSVGMVAYPAVSSCSDEGRAKKTLWLFIWRTSVFNGIIVLVLISLTPALIPFLFGNDFIGSITLSRLLLLGTFFVSCRRIIVEGLRGIGRPEVSTWAELSMYPFLIILGPLLIAYFNLIGLVVAVIICYFISLAITIWYYLIYGKSKLVTTINKKIYSQ
jgi:O-antigen/teichoic acid export membrane protein